MAKFEIQGFPIHYQSRGEGPDLILVHGLSGDLASWHPLVVGSLAGEFRVTTVDLRGHGRSGMPPAGYTTRDQAADLIGLMDHIGVRRAALVGHSFGGAVALHAAVLYPARVASLVVADTRVRSLQKSQGVRQWAHWQRVLAWLKRHDVELPEGAKDPDFGLLRCLAERRVAGRLEGLRAERFFIPFAQGSVRRAEQWIRLMDETTASTDYKEVAGLTSEVIQHVSSPTLALYGALSHCLPTQAALADLMPDCTAGTIQGVGHFHPIAAPEAFKEHVGRFVRRVSRREVRRETTPTRTRPVAARRRPRLADL
jgi:pimeloyl-ACP methyl ester carboxylesterase